MVGAGTAAAGVLAASITKGLGRLKRDRAAQAKLSGLGNSTQAVGQIMDNALVSVKGTAFGLGDAATVAASAVAAGVKPGKDLERTLKLTGDAATIAVASEWARWARSSTRSPPATRSRATSSPSSTTRASRSSSCSGRAREDRRGDGQARI
ncbi:hypothetical protein GS928_25915 [Rhodococcus hoagii]|nr:hypothetical protein [Prescottella equi]